MDEASPNRNLLARGDRVGRYEIVAEIAHGGMATVYVARLTSIGGFDKLFAMKVLLPHLREDRAFVNMLLDEARISAAIHHPNVVQVVDIGEHDGTPYVVMELLRGRTLSSLMRRAVESGQRLQAGAVLAILAAVAEGLHAAHGAKDDEGTVLGVVHRDVSPQNIQVGYEGEVKVLDFGIATARDRLAETQHGEVKGKLAYLAPEQLDGSTPLDPRIDVWALGVVAFECLSGQRLFGGADASTTMWNVLHREIPPLREVVPGIPRSVASVVARALQRDRDARPRDSDEMAGVFAEAARELGGGTPKELAALMATLFATDRAVEDERIAAALRHGPDPAFEEPMADDEPLGARPAFAPRRVGRPLWMASAAIVVLGAAGAGLALLDGGAPTGGDRAAVDGTTATAAPTTVGDPRRGSSSADPPTRTAAIPPVAPEPDKTRLSLDVDPRARLVLVDGTRHDERPVVIELGPEARAEVELMGPRGETASYTVGADRPPPALRLPERNRRRATSARSRPSGGDRSTADKSGSPSRDILRDVF